MCKNNQTAIKEMQRCQKNKKITRLDLEQCLQTLGEIFVVSLNF